MVPLQKPGVPWHFLPSLEQGLAAFLCKGQMVNILGSAAQKASLLAASSLTRSSSSFFTAPVKLFLAIGHSKTGHQLDVACRPSCASLTHTLASLVEMSFPLPLRLLCVTTGCSAGPWWELSHHPLSPGPQLHSRWLASSLSIP